MLDTITNLLATTFEVLGIFSLLIFIGFIASSFRM